MRVTHSKEELGEAFREAVRFSRQGMVIAEGFLKGIEVTVEGCCVDGEIFTVGISDKGHFDHCLQIANRLTYPADLSESARERLSKVNAKAVRALGMGAGITHAEYIIVDSEPHLVEIAARGGGSHVYSHVVPYLAGIPIPRLYLESLMGYGFRDRPDNVPRAANLAFFDFPAGRVKTIHDKNRACAMEGVEILLLEFDRGDILSPPQDDRSRQGQVLVFGKTRKEVLEITNRVFETVKVVVE